MNKYLFITFFTLIANVFVNGQDCKNPSFYMDPDGKLIETCKPIFVFKKEIFDIGDIYSGQKYTHDFEFTNVGVDPLVITDCKTTCGCTVAEFPKEPIMQNETKTITVIFDPKDAEGRFAKAVTIFSNSVEESKKIMLRGNIVKIESDSTAVEKVAPLDIAPLPEIIDNSGM